jgi:hypothetical protein
MISRASWKPDRLAPYLMGSVIENAATPHAGFHFG